MFILTSAQLVQLLNAARYGAYGDGYEDGYAASTADIATDMLRRADVIDADFTIVTASAALCD